MSRRKLQFNKGEYYHVMNRTSSGTELYKDVNDYNLFLEKIYHYAEACNIKIIAINLMPTHYHIVLKQDGEVGVNNFIQRLSISYTWHYRKRYGHHGSLFGGRFNAILIADLHQMRTVCCYVHANSWKAGLVDKPIEWEAGNIALFYSKEFWNGNPDPFLLEAFYSEVQFKNYFHAYLRVNTPLIKPILSKSDDCKLETG